MAFLNWLQETGYSQWILTSARGWPLMLSLHAIGLAIIVGVMFSLNLRLLGLYRSLPFTSLHGLMGIAWIGIWMNILTGLSVFITRGSQYIVSVPFLVKMAFIAGGIVVLITTRKILARDAASWEAAGAAPPIAKWLGLSSLAFWIVAVVTGRLIAYIGYT